MNLPSVPMRERPASQAAPPLPPGPGCIRPQVESLDPEPKQPFEPFHSATDGGGITTRWLNSAFHFNISVVDAAATGARAAVAAAAAAA